MYISSVSHEINNYVLAKRNTYKAFILISEPTQVGNVCPGIVLPFGAILVSTTI